MRLDTILAGVARTLGTVKVGGAKGDPALAALDRGILSVALMVAGLDGTILPAEYAAFAQMAKSFAATRGRTRSAASALSVRACLDAAAPHAGRLVVMAQTGAYDEKERLAALVQMAQEVLPRRFSCGSLADLRRALALWTAMAVADGTFSELERKALAALAAWCATVDRSRGGSPRQNEDGSPSDLTRQAAASTVSLLEPDFFEKAEKIVRRLNSEAKRAEAEVALQEFVGTVESVAADGRRHALPAAGIALGIAAACLAVG